MINDQNSLKYKIKFSGNFCRVFSKTRRIFSNLSWGKFFSNLSWSKFFSNLSWSKFFSNFRRVFSKTSRISLMQDFQLKSYHLRFSIFSIGKKALYVSDFSLKCKSVLKISQKMKNWTWHVRNPKPIKLHLIKNENRFV